MIRRLTEQYGWANIEGPFTPPARFASVFVCRRIFAAPARAKCESGVATPAHCKPAAGAGGPVSHRHECRCSHYRPRDVAPILKKVYSTGTHLHNSAADLPVPVGLSSTACSRKFNAPIAYAPIDHPCPIKAARCKRRGADSAGNEGEVLTFDITAICGGSGRANGNATSTPAMTPRQRARDRTIPQGAAIVRFASSSIKILSGALSDLFLKNKRKNICR
jgi:hypothetical protein